ncbi:hypothetical protein B0H11DRAFT_2250219 [Mycena galericulata]|nr:hypothetical protein B0H11DRAFT_2250219 [Mycena galericulata]
MSRVPASLFFTPTYATLSDSMERQTRNGRVYAAFVENDTVVIPGLRIRDVLIARAEAPQPQDSDSDSDGGGSFSDDDHGDNGDNGDDQAAPPALPPPISKRARPHDHGGDDHGGDNDGDNDDGPPAPPASPPPPTKRARPHDSVPLDPTARKKLKKKLAHRERRREHRETDRDFTPSRPKAVSIMRIRQSDPLSVPVHYMQHTRPVASTSWMGLRDSAIENAAARDAPPETPAFALPEARPYTLDEILDPDMHMVFVNWDGTPTPVVDEDRVIFALLAGRPRDTQRWQEEVATPAAELVDEAATKIFGADVFYGESYGGRKHTKHKKNGKKGTPASEKPPRRGSFHAKTAGVSLGGGQEAPTGFFHAALTLLTLAQLFSSQPFQRIAGFVNTMLLYTEPEMMDRKCRRCRRSGKDRRYRRSDGGSGLYTSDRNTTGGKG